MLLINETITFVTNQTFCFSNNTGAEFKITKSQNDVMIETVLSTIAGTKTFSVGRSIMWQTRAFYGQVGRMDSLRVLVTGASGFVGTR